MKLFQLYHLLFSILSLAVLGQQYAKRGCNDMCGNVRIPYPFGIGANCSINNWYVVDCNSSAPYLSALNNIEILHVDLTSQTVTVNVSIISDCQNPVQNSSQMLNGLDLGRSPFLFSKVHNKFVFEGCGNAFILEKGSVVGGCLTSCVINGSSSNNVSVRNKCFGIGCCETTIPHYVKSYTVNLMGLERPSGGCTSAFLVDDKSYAVDHKSYVPVSLLWTLAEADYNNIYEKCYSYRFRVKLDLNNGTSMESWKCADGYTWRPCQGNPYLGNGCLLGSSKECLRCQAVEGRYCNYDPIYDGGGSISQWNFTCSPVINLYQYHETKSSLGTILGNASSIFISYHPWAYYSK